MNPAQNTLIIGRNRAANEELAQGVGEGDTCSPCILIESVCGVIEELRRQECIKRIIFNPEIHHKKRDENWSKDGFEKYEEAIRACFQRADMSHIFFHLFRSLRPELCQERGGFFGPIHFLCDTDATNAEYDTKIAAKDVRGLQIHTRREILKELGIDEKTPDYRVKMAQHFAKFGELK